ncbi:hypothetical protein ACVWQM_03485 [Neisseria meningitidis]
MSFGIFARRGEKYSCYGSPNHQKYPNRHSRAGGNLVCSVSVIFDKCLLLFISRFPLSWE